MSVYSNNQYSKARVNDAWTKIFQFVPTGARILDIGCSSGQLGAALKKEKKAYVIGLDIDKADVKRAQKNLDEAHLLNIEQDDPSRFGTFDVIILADVIEHLVDPVSELKKVRPLLKKNGRLIFSIPNMANITIRIELLKGRFEYKDFGLLDRTHLHFYDKKEVERVFKAAGYQVTETDCTVREIPNEILQKDLEPLGIELTPRLLKALNDTEATTYQFIGWAKPSDKPKGFELHTTSPLDSISIHIEELNAHYKAEIKRRDKEIKHLQGNFAAVNAKLNEILSSKGWKMLEKVYTAKSKLRSRQ